MSVVARKSKDHQVADAKRRTAIKNTLLKSQRAPKINTRNKLDCASFSGFG